VPESLAKIVQKVMSKEPGARYRMADQLGHILISYRDRGREHTVPGAARNVEPPAAPPTVPHQSVVPPPPPPQQQRPQTPPPAPGSMPTVRYDAAPHAPNPVVYGRPPAQSTQSDSRGISQPAAPGMARMGGDSRPLAPPRQYSRPMRAQVDEPFQLDAVTIALGIIAFMAVACLIPLYIVALAN
jgi:hypothetical protein